MKKQSILERTPRDEALSSKLSSPQRLRRWTYAKLLGYNSSEIEVSKEKGHTVINVKRTQHPIMEKTGTYPRDVIGGEAIDWEATAKKIVSELRRGSPASGEITTEYVETISKMISFARRPPF